MTETNVVPFLFEGENLIRVIDRQGEPWFLAADICRSLNVKNASQAVTGLDDDEKATITLCNNEGGQRVIVSESGLYALVLRSHAAMRPGTTAHRFRKWVTSELLPAIRKTGTYGSGRLQDETDEMSLSFSEKRLIVNMFTKIGGPRAGAEKALQLGFKGVPALDAVLAQKQFTFVVDLDETPPTVSEAVN